MHQSDLLICLDYDKIKLLVAVSFYFYGGLFLINNFVVGVNCLPLQKARRPFLTFSSIH